MSEQPALPLLERRADERTLDSYQLAAARTVNPALDDAHRFLDAAAGLSEEAGEVLSHARKHVLQGRPLDRDAVIDELGDALWCLAVAAKTVGVTLSGVAMRNEEKLRMRHPDGFQRPPAMEKASAAAAAMLEVPVKASMTVKAKRVTD